jgi:hypothetical protein
MKDFKGTYNRQVELVQATELDLTIAQEHGNPLENKIELLDLNLQVVADKSEGWKRKYNEMFDRMYGNVDFSRNYSRKSFKIAATPTERLRTKQSTPPHPSRTELSGCYH